MIFTRVFSPLAVLLLAKRKNNNEGAATLTSVERSLSEFQSDENRLKPLGFYTWSHDLEAIFRQDRFLQTPLEDQTQINALAAMLCSDKNLLSTYSGFLDLMSSLTNPLNARDLRSFLQDSNGNGSILPNERVCFFPPSRTHETDLVSKLFGDQSIPEGFELLKELIRRIRREELDLRPNERSGWYGYQTWSIEPFVTPSRMTEAKHLWLRESYCKHLENGVPFR